MEYCFHFTGITRLPYLRPESVHKSVLLEERL